HSKTALADKTLLSAHGSQVTRTPTVALARDRPRASDQRRAPPPSRWTERRVRVRGDYEPQLNRRTKSAGCDPLPDVAVAVAPLVSVTVNVTESGCDAPSVVAARPPHLSTMSK